MKSLTVTSGRHPFEILMLVAAFIAGIAYILRLGGRGVPEQLIPGSAVWAWYLCLSVGAGVALIGVYLPQATIIGLYKSLIVERTGLLLLGASCALYEVALIARSAPTPRALWPSSAGSQLRACTGSARRCVTSGAWPPR